LGSPALLGGVLNNLADVVRSQNPSYARSLYMEAMRLFESAGDEENAIWSLSHQADLYLAENNPVQARLLYQKALNRFRALKYPHGIASCLNDLAGLEIGDGRLAEAGRMCRESLILYGPENPREIAIVLELFGHLAQRLGEPARALKLLGAAAGIRERAVSWSNNLERRHQVEGIIEAVRREVGPTASDLWMEGWNTSLEELVKQVLGSGVETCTSSQQQSRGL
jgi:tetratricopeptide (TPR) repeat protein